MRKGSSEPALPEAEVLRTIANTLYYASAAGSFRPNALGPLFGPEADLGGPSIIRRLLADIVEKSGRGREPRFFGPWVRLFG